MSPLDLVVADLVRTRHVNGRTVIHLPMATQSGGGVSVTVWPEPGGTYLVSDDGMAYHEIVTAMASERVFARVAGEACQRHGASFDGLTMLFMRVSPDRLRGSVVAMGSLVKEVVDRTVERSFSVKLESTREEFIRRVGEVFTPAAVAEEVTVEGYSTTQHRFDAVVTVRGRVLAFDFFSPAPPSVSAAFLKLADIARLDDGPRPIGVTPDQAALGTKLALVSSVARIIQPDASAKVLAGLAT